MTSRERQVDPADVELVVLTPEHRLAAKISRLELDDEDGADGRLRLDKALLTRAPRLTCRSDLVSPRIIRLGVRATF